MITDCLMGLTLCVYMYMYVYVYVCIAGTRDGKHDEKADIFSLGMYIYI